MVKLDRVEMIRANIGTGSCSGVSLNKRESMLNEEEKDNISLTVKEQRQSSVGKVDLLALRDDHNSSCDEGREERTVSETDSEEEGPESREDVPAVGKNRYGLRNNEAEVFIEAAFETVLEEDAILMARKTAIDGEEDENENENNIEKENEDEGGGGKSEQTFDPIMMTKTPSNEQEPSTASNEKINHTKPLMAVDEETELELGGIEVEYGISTPFPSLCDGSQASEEELNTKYSSTCFNYSVDNSEAGSSTHSESECNNNNIVGKPEITYFNRSGDHVQVDLESTPEADNSEIGSNTQSESECNNNDKVGKPEIDQSSKEENSAIDKISDEHETPRDNEKEGTIQSYLNVSAEVNLKIMSKATSVTTTTIKDDDTMKSESDRNSFPTLPAADATWSFDSTLKRRKIKESKPRVTTNVFPGFEEEDENDIALDATWSFDTTMKTRKTKKKKKKKIKLEERNISTGFNEEDEKGTTLCIDDDNGSTNKADNNTGVAIYPVNSENDVTTGAKLNRNDVDTTKEETIDIKETSCTVESESTADNDCDETRGADVAELISDEDTEAFEADQRVSAFESMEFDAILESVADYIENNDWEAFIAAVKARPSLATLSPADFFPSEFSGFLAAGANESVLLHEVCKNQPSVEAVKALIEVHEAAVQTAGQWGYLPIHCACASGASEAVINELMVGNPESIERFGDDNMFPLHLACKKGTSEGTIKLLLTAYPPACIIKDVYDNTPMDYILSCPEGPLKQTILELLGHQIQSMCLSTLDFKEKLRQNEKKSSCIKIELSEKQRKVTALERELEELYEKSLSVEEELKEKQERTVTISEKLKESQEKIVLIERELGEERAKASVFGENLKIEFTKSCLLESELRDEQAKSFTLEIELKTNCNEWNALGKEMEMEFKKSSMELEKERNKIAVLETKLNEEQEKSSNFEGQLKNQCDKSFSLDMALNNERENVFTIQEKLVDSKQRWLMGKQELHEKNDLYLAEAYHIINESEENTRFQNERRLVERQKLYEKNDIKMTEAYKLVEETERNLKGKHVKGLFERQELYDKAEHQLVEAYQIICKTETNLEEERTKGLLERQNTYEENGRTLAEAYKIIYDTEMDLKSKLSKLHDYEVLLEERQRLIEQECQKSKTLIRQLDETEIDLKSKQSKLHDYEVSLEERQTLIEHECQKSKTLIRQLELARTVSNGKLRNIGDELALQKSFSESQVKQIRTIESSIELKLTTDSEIAIEQHQRLVREKSLTDEIMTRIKEKKKLIQENENMVCVLEKSNTMKQELLELQQRKVEALEVGRREKEKQLKSNQEVTIKLEKSISKKQALEKEEIMIASKLAGTRASRKAAIDIEEDQIKELDYTLARKEALIELERMKEKTLEQSIAKKHRLIDSEVERIKELELLIAQKKLLQTSERDAVQALKATTTEKDAILASEKDVVSELRRTRDEKEKILEAKNKTEELIQSRIEENEVLLASKKAAIEEVHAAEAEMNSELEIQEAAAAEVEKQIKRKKALIIKEEYIAKCLQELILRKKEIMPLGPASYFVNATFGMKFLLKETFLASSYDKTQIREQSASVRQRKDNVLARVPGIDVCKSLVLNGPKLLMSSFLRNFSTSLYPTSSKSSKI